MKNKELIKLLRNLKRYDMESRWSDYLEFQQRDVYRIHGIPTSDGDWVSWEELKKLLDSVEGK